MQGFLSLIANRYVAGLPVDAVHADHDTGTLTTEERRFLRGIRWRTSIQAFLISVVCAVGFFLPAYLGWYPETTISAFGRSFAFQWAFWLAMIPWLLIEIILLVFLNLRSVQQAAVGTGFLTPDNAGRVGEHVAQIALTTPARELARFGLDPYQDANPIGLAVYNFLQLTKGFLAHQLVKLLLIGIGGRAALRAVLDFSGVPIYGAINIIAANRILNEAEIIIMGRKAVEQLAGSLPELPRNQEFADTIYDALQFVAMSKRDFHPNHVALADAVLGRYGIPLRESHRFTSDSISRFGKLPAQQREIVTLVLVCGLILDGRLSQREGRRLKAFDALEVLGVSLSEINGWAHDFRSGKGVHELIGRFASRRNQVS